MNILRRFREWKYRRMERRISRMFKRWNAKMIAGGWSRQRRQQFWHNLEKHDSARGALFDAMGKK